MRQLPPEAAPGTAYEYSNFGFAILGRIVANASGVPYLEFMQKEILTPLHMTASGFEPERVPASVRATAEDSAARHDWHYFPKYDFERTFSECLIPAIRVRYLEGKKGAEAGDR